MLTRRGNGQRFPAPRGLANSTPCLRQVDVKAENPEGLSPGEMNNTSGSSLAVTLAGTTRR